MDISKETWQNVTKGTVAVLKLDVRGMEYGHVVPAGRKFSVSLEERRLNQDRAATEGQDLFSNGTLEPTGSWAAQLVDSAADDLPEEYQEIAANPNFMSESELKELFKLRIDAFRRRLGDLSNVALVERVMETAKSLDAKASQIAAIQTRLDEFKPELLVEVESAAPPLKGKSGPSTPA